MKKTFKYFIFALIAIGFIGCTNPFAVETTNNTLAKVVFFAIDGLEWDVLHPLLQNNELPNIKKLMDSGVYGDLISLPLRISKSPVIWTTIATGDKPSEHGIIDYFIGGKPALGLMIKTQRVWDILSEYNKTVGLIGYFLTWPAEKVNGYIVSDRLHYLLNKGLSKKAVSQVLDYLQTNKLAYPPSILNDFMSLYEQKYLSNLSNKLKRFMSYTYDSEYRKRFDKTSNDYFYNFLIEDRLANIFVRDKIYMDVADYMISNFQQPDFFALYLRGPDYVSHGFWRYYEPEKNIFTSPKLLRKKNKINLVLLFLRCISLWMNTLENFWLN